MKYLSVASGIEAATVAWHPLGWSPVAFSEIDDFPGAVLAHHYPDVPNWGDMNRFKEWPDVSNVDLLVGGTPCQSFSLAGLRAGLDDPRGNLALVYLAVAARYRPRWLVWENVPGVLSSDGGRDFAAIVGGMVELGYGAAWRVLDAQHFGVPQRRRRVFLVGCLGDWRLAGAVLFEPEGMRGDSPPSREKGTGSIPAVANSIGAVGGGYDYGANKGTLIPLGPGGEDLSHALSARDAKGPCSNLAQSTLIAFSCKDHGQDAGELSPTLRAMNHTTSSPNGGGQIAVADETAIRRLTPRECERLQGFPDDYTLIPWRTYQEAQRKGVSYESLLAERGMRLREPAGETCPDGPRYKALGNSMAVPVMRWIGERIDIVDTLKQGGAI